MKLLIVDDSKAMQMLVRRTLRQAGFGDHTIEEADNAEKALAVLRNSAPDIVLSDWNMPGASGLELLKSIRKEGIVTRFGFVTSEGSAEMRSAAEEAGAEFLIAKPFTVQAFQAALGPILAGSTGVTAPTKPVEQIDPIPKRPDGLPTDADLRRFLSELFGQSVQMKSGERIVIGQGPSVVATYEDATGEITAILVADISSAVYLAAALSLIPNGPVNEALRKKVLDPSIQASFREVANILAAAIQGASGRHVKLHEVIAPPDKAPALIQAIAKKPSARKDFAIEVGKYGSGLLGFALR